MITEKHALGLLPLSFAKLLERFAFYGMRSLFFIYATRLLAIEQQDVLSFYSKYILIVGLLPLLGALIGDLVLSVRVASLIGLGLEAVGCFTMAVPSQLCFYAGLVMTALGAGLYTPNSLAMIGFMYRARKKLMDSAVTFLFIGINVGAIISQSLMGYIADESSYIVAFAFCGVFALGAFFLVLFSNSLQQDVPKRANIYTTDTNPSTLHVSWRIVLPIVLAFSLAAYFLIMQFSADTSTQRLFSLSHSGDFPISPMYLLSVEPMIIIITGVVLGILWSFFDVSSLIKIAAGFGIFAVALLPAACIHEGSSNASFLLFLLLNALFQGVSEMFVNPIVYSFICQHAPPKFMSTILAGCEAIGYGFFALYSYVIAFRDMVSAPVVYGLFILTAVVIGGFFLVSFFVTRKKS